MHWFCRPLDVCPNVLVRSQPSAVSSNPRVGVGVAGGFASETRGERGYVCLVSANVVRGSCVLTKSSYSAPLSPQLSQPTQDVVASSSPAPTVHPHCSVLVTRAIAGLRVPTVASRSVVLEGWGPHPLVVTMSCVRTRSSWFRDGDSFPPSG